ncbi:hypothetical protein [Neptunomonas sp.]|uniref:hypothetical protein n=1 Tax=Neptunomonas sp. TaxID=1971898 RepID=UPI00356209D5
MSDNFKFYKTFIDQCKAIDLCIGGNFVLPSLCLIYSGIDAAAWVAYGDIPVKERFVRFVSEFMYKEKPLDPQPIDLYAARCAVLHTMTPDSKLSKNNKAVPVSYAWGTADLEELKKAADTLKPGELSYLHLNDLSLSFRLGLALFVEHSGDNEECKERIKKHYSHLSKEIVSNFNKLNI